MDHTLLMKVVDSGGLEGGGGGKVEVVVKEEEVERERGRRVYV